MPGTRALLSKEVELQQLTDQFINSAPACELDMSNIKRLYGYHYKANDSYDPQDERSLWSPWTRYKARQLAPPHAWMVRCCSHLYLD